MFIYCELKRKTQNVRSKHNQIGVFNYHLKNKYNKNGFTYATPLKNLNTRIGQNVCDRLQAIPNIASSV